MNWSAGLQYGWGRVHHWDQVLFDRSFTRPEILTLNLILKLTLILNQILNLLEADPYPNPLLT